MGLVGWVSMEGRKPNWVHYIRVVALTQSDDKQLIRHKK